MTTDPAAWEALLTAVEGSAVAEILSGSLWLYPTVEILHIIGFVLLVGSAFVFDLRLLGFLPRLPITHAVRHLTRWARRSLFLVVPSGALLFVVDATTLAANPAFRIKLILIVAAGINAGLFHWVTFRRGNQWDDGSALPLPARLAGVTSILLWFSVIACGRLIAYL